MSDYDTYKTRSDRDERDGFEAAYDDALENEVISEKEYAVYDAERAYETLVQWHGQDEARLIMFRIVRKMGKF